jgi:hypothetical protein
MTKRRLLIAAGVVAVLAGTGIFAFLRFPLGAVEEPGALETWAATRAKHLLVERVSRTGIPPSPRDLPSSLVDGDKVFGVDCLVTAWTGTGPQTRAAGCTRARRI